jgi:tetratricopeptide (TPR) repeat protein
VKLPHHTLAALALALAGCGDDPAPPAPPPADAPAPPPAEAPAAPADPEAYAGSAVCAGCHAELHERWALSHHARAERGLQALLDDPAFVPERAIAHAGFESRARARDGTYELVTEGVDGEPATFEPSGAFGVFPLWQYLVPAERGRVQVTELAWDPTEGEWFDVYGDEARRGGEWGHWTGRGMSWNAMCASCHNTALDKGYDPASDSFDTTRVERGVGCESCHGPRAEHVSARRRGEVEAPTGPADRAQWLDTCGACHARRSELTGAFRPGDRFLDHHVLNVPDLSDTYHPDGQVRDENFEFTSFLGSRMHDEGVTCMDCHDPHGGELVLEGDVLCLTCHSTRPTFEPHDFHARGADGKRPTGCVDCHMPLTTYMQRHPRRDHGFTIPDPSLTVDHGVPNACDRCHDEGAEWARDRAREWWPELEGRATQQRARAVARAREGDPAAGPALLDALEDEKNARWRATLLEALAPWLVTQEGLAAFIEHARDESALVRTTVARSLAPLASLAPREVGPVVAALARDEVRSVRVEAQRALCEELPPDAPEMRDLLASIEHNLDQPPARVALAEWLRVHGRAEEAVAHLRRALEWDPDALEALYALATALSGVGEVDEAITVLERALGLSPADPRLRYGLALLYAEAGREVEALRAFEAVVATAPDHERAWMNLGILRSQTADVEGALEALGQAARVSPSSPEAHWVAGTVLLEAGRLDQAEEAGRAALARDPRHTGARSLLSRIAAARKASGAAE